MYSLEEIIKHRKLFSALLPMKNSFLTFPLLHSFQVMKPHADIASAKEGLSEKLNYKSVTGIKIEESSDSESEESSNSSSDEEKSERVFRDSHRPRDESPNSKKVRIRNGAWMNRR